MTTERGNADVTESMIDVPARPTSVGQVPDGGALLPWGRAATLQERRECPDPLVGIDERRAAVRWHRWTMLPALGPDAVHDEVLEPLGVTAQQLRSYLGEPDDLLRQRLGREPEWYRRFHDWWLRDRRPMPALEFGLLAVVAPLVAGAQEDLRRRSDSLAPADDPWTESVVTTAAHLLIDQPPLDELATLSGPALVLELNVARVEGALDGETTEERYENFVRGLDDPVRALGILAEYPVLARLVVQRLTFWVERSVEFLAHLRDDAPTVQSQLLAGGSPELTGVSFGAGDSHRRGRSVGMVRFGATTVVYKPRDPQADVAFDRLLAWYGSLGPTHALYRTKLVAKGDRLWVEFVPSGVPTDESGADRFTHRLGALTALLYGLHSTDFHFENVVATGEHPVLVDLEALLHVEKSASVNSFQREVSIAARVLGDSVATVGILPNRIITKTDGTFRAVDVSAVSGRGGQDGIATVPAFVEVGLDTMHIVYQYMEMSRQRNNPERGDGSPLDLLSRVDQFRAGFCEAYDLLRSNGSDLRDQGGPMQAFAQVRARFIARPTFVYGRLLLQSYHPDFLRDALDRSLCLGKLLAGHAGAPDRAAMIRAEIEEMYDGDIPMFTVDAADGVVRGGSDATPVSQQRAPIAVVMERLEGLSKADRDLQAQVIDYSFLASSIDGQADRWPGWTARRPVEGAPSGDYFEAAGAVAADVLRMACHRDGRRGWLGLELVDERWWTLGPASLDLYAGTPGIALALSTVGSLIGDDLLQEAAQDAFDQVAQHVARLGEAFVAGVSMKKAEASPGIGAFGPIAGPMYALVQGAVRHGMPEWRDAALQLVPMIGAVAERDDAELDVVAGAAGAILALLAIEGSDTGGSVMSTAERLAERLLERATVPLPGTMAWSAGRPGEPPLVGFSHGALGVAVALASLHARRPDPRYLAAIDGALAYERAHHDPATGDWEDLRVLANGQRATPMRAWCHGAPGAALGRRLLLDLCGSQLADADAVRRELRASIDAVWETGLGGADEVTGLGNHSICHGDIGNLLCLESAIGPAVGDGDDAERRRVDTAWAALLASGRRDGFATGVPKGVATPGLMTGLSGIAWGIARRAAPGAVPDVLSLQGLPREPSNGRTAP